MSKKQWLLIAIAILLIWIRYRSSKAAAAQQPTLPIVLPKSSGSSGLSSGGGYTETTTPTETVIETMNLPSWLTAIARSYSAADKDLSVWMIGTGLIQTKLERVDGGAVAGNGWTSGAWSAVETAASLSYPIAPYLQVKRFNHEAGKTGLTPGQYRESFRRVSAPSDVYTIVYDVGNTIQTTLLAGTLPTVSGGGNEVVSTTLPNWLTAIARSYSAADKDLSAWLLGTGPFEIKIDRVDATAESGLNWQTGDWESVESAGSLTYPIAPYSHVKRYNHEAGENGVGLFAHRISVRQTASPNDVYAVTFDVTGSIATTLLAGTLPTDNGGGDTGTGEDTIDGWARPQNYGAARLKYVNDKSFFDPVIVDNGDGMTYHIVDNAANYQPGGGKGICIELDYYGADRSLTGFVGRNFEYNIPLLMAKFEYTLNAGQGQSLIDARQEINEVIF